MADVASAEGQCAQLQSELGAARAEFKRYMALKAGGTG